jgi:hypothetical protein
VRKVVDDEVYTAGRSLILQGAYTELIMLIKGEIPWVKQREDIITQLAQLAEWAQPGNKDMQSVALSVWEPLKGTKRRSVRAQAWLERLLILFVGVGALSGIVSLIWLLATRR